VCACKAVGSIGENAATDALISKLLSVLRDESIDIRNNACIALGKMGTKGATNEVISELMSALGDGNHDIRLNAWKALGKMGEKMGTNDVISKLTILANSGPLSESHSFADAVRNILCSSAVITRLDAKTVLELCLHEHGFKILKNASVDQLINSFVLTENSSWLPVLALFTLWEGIAVTITKEKVVVYGRNEPLELFISRWNLCEQLIKSFTDQAERLHLSFEMPSEAPRNESKVSSSFCDLL
jgi:hypothetical protein